MANANLSNNDDSVLEQIKAIVDEVHSFRDEFVSVRGLEAAGLRDNEVEARVKEALAALEPLSQNAELQSGVPLGRVCYEKGRLLRLCTKMEAQAEQYLGRASKFNIPGAWTLLGECLYGKGDLTGAATCFNRALSASGDEKVALRNLSMLMRSKPFSSEEQREDNINKGVDYARQAVKADPADGESWLVLGNSLLASFFGGHGTHTTLQAVKAAYGRAERDKKASLLPELHFSKFQVAWYEEQYGSALNSLRTAYQLEPSWSDCEIKRKECVHFIKCLIEMVNKKGNLPNKRLQIMLKSIKPSQLGPYEESGSSLTNNKKPDLVSFKELLPNTNTEKIVQGKVVSTLVPESGIPFVMCLVDAEGTCLPVTVYNWAPGTEVKIGDAVAVVAPVLKEQTIELSELGVQKKETVKKQDKVARSSVDGVNNSRKISKQSSGIANSKLKNIRDGKNKTDTKCAEESCAVSDEINQNDTGNVKHENEVKEDDNKNPSLNKPPTDVVCDNSNTSTDVTQIDQISNSDNSNEKDVTNGSEKTEKHDSKPLSNSSVKKNSKVMPISKKTSWQVIPGGCPAVTAENKKTKSLSTSSNSKNSNLVNKKNIANTAKGKANSETKTSASLSSNLSAARKTLVKDTSSKRLVSKDPSDLNSCDGRLKDIKSTTTAPPTCSKTDASNTLSNRKPPSTQVKNVNTKPSKTPNTSKASPNSASKTSKPVPASSSSASSVKKSMLDKDATSPSSCDADVKAAEMISLRSIRVIAPIMLIVNRRPVTSSQVAASYLVSQNKPE